MPREGESVITIKEFAKRLSLHPQTVYEWLREGKIKAFKVSNRVRIPISEVDRIKQVYPIKDGQINPEPPMEELPKKDEENPQNTLENSYKVV